jgi:hypothetical protein
MFVLAWWLIYSAAAQRRLFALVAFVTGGVFFSGYVQLFHIYGLAYVPVMLTLGGLLRFHAAGTFNKQEVWFAAVTTLLVCWHPFATALFVGFYFGYYLDTFGLRSRTQHIQAVAILAVGATAVVTLIVGLPRFWPGASQLLIETATRSLDTRLAGFLASYQTTEVNRVATLVAFLLTQMVVFSSELSSRLKLSAILSVSVLSVVFVLNSIPVLLLWLGAVLIKLLRLRCWSLFFLALTAALLPFGGGIGSPIHALFAIIIAGYATALGWSQAEKVLSFVKARHAIATTSAAVVILLMIRAGIEVPIIKRVASPLLVERERTYQLEKILAWLHDSKYCGYEIAFAERADNPIDSVESAITRRNRPPASLADVQLFWKTVLQCGNAEGAGSKAGITTVTFGAPALANSRAVLEVEGRHAGEAVVWIRDARKD